MWIERLTSGVRPASRFPGRDLRRARGFTLIELLVVVSIIAIVVGISFPFLRGMARTSNVQMAANSVLTAVSGARAYATRSTPPEFLQPIDSGGGPVRTAHDDGDGYSGAAVIVTPSNDLRIVENHAAAKDTAGEPLELHQLGNLNGYRHIGKRDPDTGELVGGIDDIRLPSDVALLGIIRDPAGSGDIVLLPAPFAISFNNRGTIVVGGDWGADLHRNRYVIYDADANGAYDVNSARDTDNDLTEFERGVAALNDEGRPLLPWERLEPVIGVVIIDPREMDDNYVPSQTDQYDAAPSARILEQAATTGEILFFNRYTGQNVAQ